MLSTQWSMQDFINKRYSRWLNYWVMVAHLWCLLHPPGLQRQETSGWMCRRHSRHQHLHSRHVNDWYGGRIDTWDLGCELSTTSRSVGTFNTQVIFTSSTKFPCMVSYIYLGWRKCPQSPSSISILHLSEVWMLMSALPSEQPTCTGSVGL